MIRTSGATTEPARPPGPTGHPLFGHTLALAKDPLHYLASCVREYGDLFFLRVRWLDVLVASGPAELDDVFGRRSAAFTLDKLSRGLRDALGDSLLVTDGATWRRQRGTVLPAFRQDRMAPYTTVIRELADRELAGWPECGFVDVSERMADLALAAVVQTVLGIESTIDRGRVADGLRTLMKQVRGILGTGVRLPTRVPTPGNVQARRAIADIDRVLEEVSRVADGWRADGVLGLLRAGVDSGSIDEQQVRDELLTMLLVGHETVALAVTYACWLLAGDEDLQQAVLDEVLASSDSSWSLPEAMRDTPLLLGVVKEALRLFPPVWAMGREVCEPVELGSYSLEVGTQVLIPIWANHRRPDWYRDPDSFRPERWLTGEVAGLPPYAFFPFGAGVRSCLGERLAYQEIGLVLRAILTQFRLANFGTGLAVVPSVTLRPRSSVFVFVDRR